MHTSACAAVVLDSQAEPVTPFRVLGETGIATRLEASSRTGLTPYVGRQSELSTLQARVARAAADAGSVVAVVGEPGAGKSRLLYELQESLRTEPGLRLVQARCRAYGDGVPYGVFVQILCAALDLASAADRLGRRRAGARARSIARAVPAALSASAVGAERRPRVAEASARRTSSGGAARRARSGRRSADPARTARRASSRTGTGRTRDRVRPSSAWRSWSPSTPAGADRHEPRGAGRRGSTGRRTTTCVRLERLDFAGLRRDRRRPRSGVRQVSDALARRLYDRAGGNPFFLEQMCAALLEQQRGDGARRRRGRSKTTRSALALPDTVQGVIRARLDNLRRAGARSRCASRR